MSTIYDEYEAYTKKYQNLYGNKTLVLEQVGSFYEIYSDGTLLDMKEISDVLNIIVSRKNKSITEISRSNHLMAGFPLYTLKKFVNILINHDYTVVIVSQVTPPPNPKRKVTDIVSPGTRFDDIEVNETNNLASIYISEYKEWKTNINLMSVGFSVIDLSTGVSKVYETVSKPSDYYYALDELYKLITLYNPKELIIFGDINTEIDVIKYLEIENKYIHNKLNNYNKEILNITYQTQLLQKVFKNIGLLPIHDYLNLERLPHATISYIYLLQFSYQHNEHILDMINIPDILLFQSSLNISYNSSKQLNIISNNKDKTLLNILNNSHTSIGKRNFKERLLNPITNIDKLNISYDKINTYLQDKLFIKVGKNLNNVFDLERLYRKIAMNKLNPVDFIQIDISLKNILEIDEINNLEITEFMNYYNLFIDFEKLENNNNFFKKLKYENIDILDDALNNLINIFNKLILSFNSEEGFFKVEYNDKDLYHIQVTSKRFNDFKKKCTNKIIKIDNYNFNIDDFIIKTQTTIIKLSHKHFDEINELISDYKSKLQKEITEKYTLFLSEIVEKYSGLFKNLIELIGDIDYSVTCAKNAFNFSYTKPILDNTTTKSYIIAKNIRHPIIERISTQLQYIGNDIKIGIDDQDGILLYGVNSSGKSTISKSIAISIIMAQAGMYVPCDHMIYHPYTQIFTRIPTGDDLFKGLSTFSVEISELRNILKRADEKSLVCGDELASGTEQISGISIVSAAIIQLCNKKTSFIFATHLHDLTNIKKVIELNNLKVYHLSVSYNDNLGKLVYDRILKEGQGSSIYGIEVCKSLNMGIEFLNLANEIRQEYIEINKNILEPKKSRYNSKKYVDVCGICNNVATEVHHIKEQELANKDGFIDNIHKNNLHNLVNVCEMCHVKIHQNKIKVNGYVQTEDGIKLDVINIQNIILDLKSNNKSNIYILNILKTQYNIDISRYKLLKLLQII
jgi:DNA mismatch repair protein MutS